MSSNSEKSTKKMVAKYVANKSAAYVANGFKKDADNLLELFHSMRTFKYQDFCQAWKEMHFNYIFSGRNVKSEIKEFSEAVLHTTKELVVNINYPFAKRIGALYLLYGLYLLQPVDTSLKIRMTSDNFNTYMNLIAQLRHCEQLDALYIGCKLIVIRSFFFVFSPYNYGLHKSFRKYHDETTNIFNVETFSMAKPIETLTMKSGLINALNQINEKYYQAKCVLPGAVGVEPEESLKLSDPNIGNKILENWEELYSNTNEPSTSKTLLDDGNDSNCDEPKKNIKRDSIYKRRKLLRQRAFTAKTETTKTRVSPKKSPRAKKPNP